MLAVPVTEVRRGSCPKCEEVPKAIVGGLDVHRQQITFDYVDTVNGEVSCGQIGAADRRRPAAWLERFGGCEEVEFAVKGCTGWRYVAEELTAAGARARLAEPADTAAARGRKKRAKTDRADSRLMRELLVAGKRSPGRLSRQGPAVLLGW